MKKIIITILTIVMLTGFSVNSLATENSGTPLWEEWGFFSKEEMLDFFVIDEEMYQTIVQEEWTDEQFELLFIGIEEREKLLIENTKAERGLVHDINVMFRNKAIEFTDAVPEIVNGRTMIPLRAVTETFGATVEYDDETKTATITLDEIEITISENSQAYTLKNADSETESELDSPAYIKDGRMFIPLRTIGEAFGYTVNWDEDYQTAVIFDVENIGAETDEKFTVLNQFLNMYKLKNVEETLETSTQMTYELKVFGSENQEEQSLEVSAIVDILQDENALEATADFELIGAYEFWESSNSYPSDVEKQFFKEIFDKIDSDEISFLLDKTELMMYFNGDVIDFLLEKVEVSGNDIWISYDYGETYEYMPTYAGLILGEDSFTFGKQHAYYFFDSRFYRVNFIDYYDYYLSELSELEFLSDEALIKTDKGYKLEHTFSDDYGTGPVVIDIVMENDRIIDISGTFDVASKADSDYVFDFDLDFKIGKNETDVTMIFLEKDLGELTFTMNSDTKISDKTPKSAPDADEFSVSSELLSLFYYLI